MDLTWILVIQIIGAPPTTQPTHNSLLSDLLPPVREIRLVIPAGPEACQAIIDANPDTDGWECIATTKRQAKTP
jgi:hypothetical protein